MMSGGKTFTHRTPHTIGHPVHPSSFPVEGRLVGRAGCHDFLDEILGFLQTGPGGLPVELDRLDLVSVLQGAR